MVGLIFRKNAGKSSYGGGSGGLERKVGKPELKRGLPKKKKKNLTRRL